MGCVTTSCGLDRAMSLKRMATKRGFTQLLVQMTCKGEMAPANMGHRNLNYMDVEHIDLILACVSITGGLLFVLLCAFQGHSNGHRWTMEQIHSAYFHTAIIFQSKSTCVNQRQRDSNDSSYWWFTYTSNVLISYSFCCFFLLLFYFLSLSTLQNKVFKVLSLSFARAGGSYFL